MLAKENPNNENDRKTAALWENHMDETAFKLHLKKGGSQFNKDQPYIRLDTTFNHKFKMDRLIKTVSILVTVNISFMSFFITGLLSKSLVEMG